MRSPSSIVLACVAFLAVAVLSLACGAAGDGGDGGDDSEGNGNGNDDNAVSADSNLSAGGAPAGTVVDGVPIPAGCAVGATTELAPLVTATADGEAVLTIEAQSLSNTSWAEKNNEAVVLEVMKATAAPTPPAPAPADRKRLGHFILHQGRDRFTYAMHAGALRSGDVLSIRVSNLTASRAAKGACISSVTLAAPPANMLDGFAHAPIVKWPKQKSFDDVPVMLGWSRAGKSYQLTMTHENGGTPDLCGGGARGMRSEIARWGRGLDMEGSYSYGGQGRFARCTGAVAPTANLPRMVDQHPVLYYGDGHNRVFESRGGYGSMCGTGTDTKADGDIEGWNKNNPGNEEEKDDPFTIVLRPAPVDLDALDYPKYGGRREGLVDTYAPWLYRLVDSELAREGRIDNQNTFPMNRYLFIDVYAKDVGGVGDETCGGSSIPGIPRVQGGFRIRAVAKNGSVSNGPQMTATYFGGNGSGVKRIAVPLENGVKAADIEKIIFDAYDGDGIYFLGIGDAFIPRAKGDNNAELDYINKGYKPAAAYVDDDNSGCVSGKSTKDGVSYPCVGSAFTLNLP